MQPERRESLRRAEDALAWKRFQLLERLIYGLIIIQLVTGGMSVYLLSQNSQRTKDIQSSRVDNIFRDCKQQDSRNAAAVLFLTNLPPEPGQRKQTPEERAQLIQKFADALVGPVVKDCGVFAEEQAK
jgi:hypothetical protein